MKQYARLIEYGQRVDAHSPDLDFGPATPSFSFEKDATEIDDWIGIAGGCTIKSLLISRHSHGGFSIALLVRWLSGDGMRYHMQGNVVRTVCQRAKRE